MEQPKAFGTKSVSFLIVISRLEPALAYLSFHPVIGFVNAQYRFVMNPLGDYTVHFADPDMYVTQTALPIGLIPIILYIVSSNGRIYCK